MSSFSWLRASRLLVVAALAAPVAAAVQTAPAVLATTPNATVATKAAHVAAAYHAAPPEQRAARMSQELARQLNLDAATTAKVQAAALVRAQKIDAIQTGTGTNKEKGTALQANAQEFKSALQGILTPAQFAQYTALKGKKKAKDAASTPEAETE